MRFRYGMLSDPSVIATEALCWAHAKGELIDRTVIIIRDVPPLILLPFSRPVNTPDDAVKNTSFTIFEKID